MAGLLAPPFILHANSEAAAGNLFGVSLVDFRHNKYLSFLYVGELSCFVGLLCVGLFCVVRRNIGQGLGCLSNAEVGNLLSCVIHVEGLFLGAKFIQKVLLIF